MEEASGESSVVLCTCCGSEMLVILLAVFIVSSLEESPVGQARRFTFAHTCALARCLEHALAKQWRMLECMCAQRLQLATSCVP